MTDTIKILAERADLVRAGGENVPSPCVSVCLMDEATGLCAGCFRTLDELRQWSTLDDAGKRVVWAQIESRMTYAAV